MGQKSFFRRPAVIAIVASLVFALGAGAFVGAAPCAVRTQESTSTISSFGLPPEEGAERIKSGCMSLLESQGPSLAWILAAPSILCAAGLVGSRLGARWLTWFVAMILLLLVVMTGFSIGLVFFPAALMLLLGAALQHVNFAASPSRNPPSDGEP